MGDARRYAAARGSGSVKVCGRAMTSVSDTVAGYVKARFCLDTTSASDMGSAYSL